MGPQLATGAMILRNGRNKPNGSLSWADGRAKRTCRPQSDPRSLTPWEERGARGGHPFPPDPLSHGGLSPPGSLTAASVLCHPREQPLPEKTLRDAPRDPAPRQESGLSCFPGSCTGRSRLELEHLSSDGARATEVPGGAGQVLCHTHGAHCHFSSVKALCPEKLTPGRRTQLLNGSPSLPKDKGQVVSERPPLH